MKYAVVQCVNGNFSIVAEYTDNIQGAIVRFHQVCANLWNSQDVISANVRIIDERQNTVMNMSEDIKHDQPEEA
jgi:hypothetical protein